MSALALSAVTIAPGHWLDAPAARSYDRMLAAGMPAGGITEAGRTRARQEYLWSEYLAGRLIATAARPGTSRHERGAALDMVTSSPAHAWLIAHGARHGWTRPLLHAAKPEPWHWEYAPTWDRHLTDDTAPVPPLTPTLEDDTMLALAKLRTSPAVYVGDGIRRRHVTTPAELADIQSMMRAGVLRGDPRIHEVVSIGWLGKEV